MELGVHWSCFSVTLCDSYSGRIMLNFLSRSLRSNEDTPELKNYCRCVRPGRLTEAINNHQQGDYYSNPLTK